MRTCTLLPAMWPPRARSCGRRCFANAWRGRCENFSPWRNATECTGMHFYHWGGLAGFISLLEAGFYAAPPSLAVESAW